jgi:class 3 adenylate cyclase
MTPEENFAFLNAFLGTIEPIFGQHRGFIASYTGDGLMALFPKSADDGVRCAIDVLRAIAAYNERRETQGRRPVGVGIGLHSGRLMLGTVGGADRMEGSVVSSIVNLASRVEQMNKVFKTALLVSDETLQSLASPDAYRHRELGKVTAKGGVDLTLHEIFDADAEDRAALKQETGPALAVVIEAYKAKNLKRAVDALNAMLAVDPEDGVAAIYLDRCQSERAGAKTGSASVENVLA